MRIDSAPWLRRHQKQLSVILLSILVVCAGLIYRQTTRPADFVLMVYMVGSDLESVYNIGTEEIRSMMAEGSSSRVKIVVQTGGASRWRMIEIEEGKINRLYIKKGEVKTLEVLDNQNMSEAAVLTDFITDTVQDFPARRYGIILWNHGSGSVYGFGNDELYDFEAMPVSELALAFEGAKAATGVTFELIAFDACLMGSLETAVAMAPYGQYMVGSEEIEPGNGYHYPSLIRALKADPHQSGEALGGVIVDGFVKDLEGNTRAQSLTLSVIDLDKSRRVAELLEEWIEDQDYDRAGLSLARHYARSYGGRTAYEGYSDMIDLGSFIRQFPDHPKTAPLLEAIQEAVPRLHHGQARSGSTGFSIYFPYYGLSEFDRRQAIYNTLEILPNYRSFTDSMIQWLEETHIAISFDSPTAIMGDGDFQVVLKEEDLPNIKTVNYLAGIRQEDGSILGLGFDNDVGYDPETTTIYNRSTGFWLGLNGHLAAVSLTEETADYNLYSIPVLLNGRQVSVQGAWFWDEGEEHGGYYEVLGVWAGINADNHTVDRDVIDVNPGDRITMLHTLETSENQAGTYVEGESFILEEDLIFDDVVMPPGDYVFAFEIVDIANKAYLSEYVTIEWRQEEYETLLEKIK